MNAVGNTAWRARASNMDLKSSRPFTRVSFALWRGEVLLYRQRNPDTAGVQLHVIESGEFPRNYWEQR